MNVKTLPRRYWYTDRNGPRHTAVYRLYRGVVQTGGFATYRTGDGWRFFRSYGALLHYLPPLDCLTR